MREIFFFKNHGEDKTESFGEDKTESFRSRFIKKVLYEVEASCLQINVIF